MLVSKTAAAVSSEDALVTSVTEASSDETAVLLTKISVAGTLRGFTL